MDKDDDDDDVDYSNKITAGVGVPSSASSSAAVTKSQEQAEAVRQSLLDAIRRDDELAVKQKCATVYALGLSLTSAELRDPSDRATVLHTALIQGRWNVATFLIQSTTDDHLLLDQDYDVTGLLQCSRICLRCTLLVFQETCFYIF